MTDKPAHYVFVLLNNFSLLSFASALECLRIANRMSGRKLYSWEVQTETGETVSCSAGSVFAPDAKLGELSREDTVLLCAGRDVQGATTKPVLNWMRREARKGLRIGGLCTGAYVLAKAGLLDGRRATIHWENHDGFTEEFGQGCVIHILRIGRSRRHRHGNTGCSG